MNLISYTLKMFSTKYQYKLDTIKKAALRD